MAKGMEFVADGQQQQQQSQPPLQSINDSLTYFTSTSTAPTDTSSTSSSPLPTAPPTGSTLLTAISRPTPTQPPPTLDPATNRYQTTIEKPFVYGTAAFWLGKQPTAPDGTAAHSHRWTVYVRGLDNDDMSYLIADVTFTLHSSFTSPVRVISIPPYEVTETGWGEFAIAITIHFNHPGLAPVHLSHLLKLFPPPTIQPTTKKPVMSEVYDELVFPNPPPDLYQLLQSGPVQRFADHPFSGWWTTKEFAREENVQLMRLVEVNEVVKERVRRERHRLWKVEQEIAQITNRMTG